ncbi:MAG: transposase [Chroococcidiopsidaceae cyanobacterium CP_BM_ER_R8_30]|nr:transposase [Chroococcidiopsidaceae cyanobacterium CP_BM_ER_R8_30]
MKAYKYRIYPTKGQERVLNALLEECRWLYNKTLEIRKNAWEEEQRQVDWYETKRMIPVYKNTARPTLGKVYSQVLQNVTERVDLAFKAFFRRVKQGETPGFPRFKGRGRYDSMTYAQSGFKIEGNYLDLSKVGRLWMILHRPVEGKVKTCTIHRSSTGKWYVCFACDVESEILPASDKVVGIDLGLTHFATLSTDEKIDNPRFFRKEEKALAKVQRRLSKEEKGTPERARRRRPVARVHERIRWKRQDFTHKLSRRLVNEFGTIVFEDLNVKRMILNHCLAKSIADASWSQLVEFTSNKAEGAGRKVILVNPRNTTKICSKCGILTDKSLANRIHQCICGLNICRDLNAAYNILRLGLQSVGSNP